MKLRSALLAFLLLIVVLLATLPFTASWAGQYFLKRYLLEQGLDNINIERVWINPYTGLTSVVGLDFRKGQEAYRLGLLTVDVALWPLTKQKVAVESINLTDVDVVVEQKTDQSLIVNGIRLPSSSESSDTEDQSRLPESNDQLWQIAVNQILLDNIRLKAKTPDLSNRTVIKQFSVMGLDTEFNSQAQVKALIELSELKTADNTVALRLNIESPLRVRQAAKNQWAVEAKPNITLSNNSLQIPGYEITLKELALSLMTTINTEKKLSYLVDGDISLKELSILDGQQRLVDLQTLALTTVFNGQELTVNDLTIQELALLSSADKRYPTLLSNAHITINKTAIVLPTESQAASVNIDAIQVEQANLQIIRDEQGELPQLSGLTQAEDDTETTSTDQTTSETRESDTAPEIVVQSLVMTPEVKVFFEDQSLSPIFSETIQFDEFELSNLKPLDKTAITNLNASLGLKHNAKLVAKGTINISTLDTDMDINISNYQLLGLSGYSEDITGYALETGTLTLNTQASIDEEQLDLENTIFIDQLNLRAANKDKTVQYANQLTMPLDKALDLLRNNKNEIKLKVPVTGLLNDPTVDLQQVINKAVASAMKKASISFLKNMLQPYSSIISIAKIANKELTKIQLDTVPFDPGQALLTDKGSDYASKIAQLLKDKSSLKLKLCGITTPADQQILEALTQQKKAEPQAKENVPKESINITSQLQSLAEQRSTILRTYLIEQDVNEKQLLICLPIHEKEADKISGVALSI